MKFPKILFLLIVGGLILTACSGSKIPAQAAVNTSTPSGCSTPDTGNDGACLSSETNDSPTESVPSPVNPTPTETPALQVNPITTDLKMSDAQGAVTVEVTPLNLDDSLDTLVFDVSMSTHSVDLSMDLAQLAQLTTDTGKTVQAVLWDAPRGGHHVEGKLSFPSTVDEKSLLDGANSITISIKDVDAPVRTFTWQLNS